MNKIEKKIVVVIMGQNCKKFIDMALESVKDADIIVYCDGGSTDGTTDLLYNKFDFDWESKEFLKRTNRFMIQNKFDQRYKGMNGKQRNYYLNYVKRKYPDWWCLVIDADEVVEDLNKIKDLINNYTGGVFSVKMRHFIGDLGHEDSTVKTHFVPNRLFKISDADYYPEVEHSVLIPKISASIGQFTGTTIWHLAYIPNMWEIKKRYENHLKKSNIHTPEFLKNWYLQHLFGQYPRKQIDLLGIPNIILNKFGINKDELYFANRGIEGKHALMVKQWYDYFKPKNVLDLGCGKGPYLFFWNWFVKDVQGIELSQFAVDHSFIPGKIDQGDITNESIYRHELDNYPWDLITTIDVLEHLNDDQLNKTLYNISNYGDRFLFSIPFKGDPNLELDKTHKQFKTKEEWIELIESHGIKLMEAPKDWLFSHQILIGENGNKI